MHTDLSAPEAAGRLRQLETKLGQIARYWRKQLSGRVVFFVAAEPERWPAESLPHPQAHLLLHRVGGATVMVDGPGERVAHVYAVTAPGVAEHELVHAYCLLTFGHCGPDWYKEGMAELAYRTNPRDGAVRCPREVIRLLSGERSAPVRKVVLAGEFTGPIAHRFGELAAGSQGTQDVSDWLPEDDSTIRRARQSYVWSWSLCHFLSQSPNYRHRFRLLGNGYVRNAAVDFEQLFAPVRDQLAFEYGMFLRHLENGYRVDLCRWDWQEVFAHLAEDQVESMRVKAAGGFQPSGLLVSEGAAYDYAASGQWSLGEGRERTTADGDARGTGRLEGAILRDDYVLGAALDLGVEGSFVAPASGKLYLRCRDNWHQLEDNAGALQVRFRRAAP
jgi:hypothetical protein